MGNNIDVKTGLMLDSYYRGILTPEQISTLSALEYEKLRQSVSDYLQVLKDCNPNP